MLRVLLLFLIPLGFGIPAGALLAHRTGVGWPVMTILYFISDVILACLFEPILRAAAAAGRRSVRFARFSESFRTAMAKTAAYYGGTGAGPFTLIMIAFGVDPMTGRAAALAAGHGFVAGWAIAIAGDMIYFVVVAACTLKVSAWLGDPDRTMMVVMAGMLIVPLLLRRLTRGKPAS
ncbi:MAG: hypothetical protein ACHQ51_04650 [Elusimicrobiota bacterium]